jgi:dihydrolipoamide dehydrogenase
MAQAQYDVIVIGSGPGGYVCAIRCAQLGMKVALIERYSTLGGTCLNVGCIPSKALLDSSEHFHNAAHHFKTHGIDVQGLSVNLTQMIARKSDVVSKTCDGVAYLMKKNKIDTYYGHGTFASPKTVSIAGNDGTNHLIEGKHIIIATGSKPTTLSGVTVDKTRIITSTEALKLTEIPKHLLVIGGGIIGLEMGSVYARLGSQVTVIEYSDRLIGSMDGDLGKEIQKILKKHLNFQFFLSHKVQGATVNGDQVSVRALDSHGTEVEFKGDYCLLAIGRSPYTQNLGLEAAGVAVDNRGRIEIDDHFRTNVPGIYAIGDVVRGAMLAHKASDEGVMLAELIAGQHSHINYRAIPSVLYTWPEVAGVGYTEEELKAEQIPYKSGKFPFAALGRARASMDTDGFIKVLAHKETDEVLGVHMIGPRCADVIAEAVVALEYRASAEDIGIFSHAHPTFAEALKEAALAATSNRAIHI